MATIITDLKNNFRRGNVHIRLIYINAAVFLVVALTGIVLRLFNLSSASLVQWFEMPASLPNFVVQPWAILTYMFLHADFLHVLFNMLWLFWFGDLFLRFFSARHLRGLYLLGGICGGLLYMLAYNVFPYFRPVADYSFLLGASASVLAIVAATAYREPNYPINLLLIGTITDSHRHGRAVHHLRQCGRAHRPPGRGVGGPVVCRQPGQGERPDALDQPCAWLGGRAFPSPEAEDESAQSQCRPSEEL